MMNATFTNFSEKMHTVALASERLCGDYWPGFDAINQSPKTLASYYKESGN
jgi:hypothetical protein